MPSLAVAAILLFVLLANDLNRANRFPVFWRSLNLSSGVSPLLPQLLLLTGFYAWFWHTLHGLSLFGDDRPVLPSADSLPEFPESLVSEKDAHSDITPKVKMFRMFSREGAGERIEDCAMPLGRAYLKSLAFLVPLAIFVLWMALDGLSFRSLGDHRFGTIIFFVIAVSIALVSAETLQLINIWSRLRQLLVYLDRLRIRRTLCTLRSLYGGSVWKLSGNVLEERYRLISRQFESMSNLQNLLTNWVDTNPKDADQAQAALDKVKECAGKSHLFAVWYVELFDDKKHGPARNGPEAASKTSDSSDAAVRDKNTAQFCDLKRLKDFQEALAETAGCLMENIILPAWQNDTKSLLCDSGSKDKTPDPSQTAASLPDHVRAAEEFFLLPYMGFIQNTLGRVRTIALSIVSLFVAATLAVSSYPFDPLPVIGAVFLILFVLIGAIMISTYAEM